MSIAREKEREKKTIVKTLNGATFGLLKIIGNIQLPIIENQMSSWPIRKWL